MFARAVLFAHIQQTLFNVEAIEPDDFSARLCRVITGTDDETDRAPACHGRKPFIRAKSFSRAKSHVAMYARL
jgi:hypothetical protein